MFGGKNKYIVDAALIGELLERSVDKVYPSKGELQKVLSSRRIRAYLGVDPTGPHLHLGHLTNLLVLRRLQSLGHEVIFLIGDFTARIGDPSGKLDARRPLGVGEVKQNLETFKEQAGRIVDFGGANAVKLRFNSEWLDKIGLTEWLQISAHVTVQQMIARDMFQERLKEGKPIGCNEFAYPLLQGYDSVALGVDLEIGGTDQTFNMLVGRDLLKTYQNKAKFVLTTRLLEHPKTHRKLMNKSEGGLINLDDSPADIFGKVMALDDAAILPVAELCTEMPLMRISALRSGFAARKINPRDAKAEVAAVVVETIYGTKEAVSARENFKKLFSKKETSVDLPPLKLPSSKKIKALDAVLASGAVKSKSEARRLIEQGGFEIDRAVKKDPNEILSLRGGEVVRIGKKRFFRISL